MACWFAANIAHVRFNATNPSIKIRSEADELKAKYLFALLQILCKNLDAFLDKLNVLDSDINLIETMLVLDSTRLNNIEFKFVDLNCIEVRTIVSDSSDVCRNVSCSVCGEKEKSHQH